MTINVIETIYEKDSKTTWKQYESTNKQVSEDYYNNSTSNSSVSFDRLCGVVVNRIRQNTPFGYKYTRITTISPDKSIKIVRDFKFSND